ncbi:hypothetical protein DL96DRAFT_1821354 [Flagelloscypha sp. PMI_526]|nr:hypothetical protein DL96DRAFT_1821354 [Flagelloscypha sp. PMI_526]
MFDIVGGSGIGGFYAILFTALNMTIDQVLVCSKILEDKLLLSPLWAGNDREGCSRLLDEALKEMQSQTGVSVELDSPFHSRTSTKCFVLVQNNSQGHHPRALRNYRVRPVPSSSCTIRQALHTTLADLEHFPPVIIQDEQFVNASMRFPNPSRELMKELVNAFPTASHLACLINVGAGKAPLVDNSETVAQDLLSQYKDVGCFFRLSMKNAHDAGVHVKSAVMGLLQEEEISELMDSLVEALVNRFAAIPLPRLANLAGEDARAKRDAQITVIHHNVEHLRDALDQSSFRRLKDWLKPIDQIGKLESSIRCRGHTTCEWFLEHPAIEGWIRKGGLCWFHGGMGTGKTFIMSHLVQSLIHRGLTVAYYYFEFTNPSTLSEEALLRSLVFQLSSIHLPTILASHQTHRGGASEPQLAALLGSIVELAGRSEQPFYIVIDALDELSPPQRMQLFKTLACMSMVDSLNMHVIISSRDEIDIMSGLGELAPHHLDILDGAVRHDIAIFVDQELAVDKWKDWPPNLIERMRVNLNERAAGQFRMVACQLEVLHRIQTTGDLEAQLLSLPRKLADTYLYILDHLIPEEERVRAQMLLRILTAAFDAVPLNELAALIAVDLGDPSDVVKLPEYRAQQQFHQPQNIVGLGAAFVRLTRNGPKLFLQLSHASVKEYLLQQNPIHWCYMNEELAHSTMAGACLALLLHNESSKSDAPIDQYVRRKWFRHLQSTCSDQLLAQQIKFFEKFPWSPETQFQLKALPPHHHKLSNALVYQSPLITASVTGLYRLLQNILVTKQLQENLDHALYLAATGAAGIKIIELLVEHGADVNNMAGSFGNALHAAALQGSLDVVQFLVEKGADMNKERGYYGSALEAAARGGHLGVVKFLVEKGAIVNKDGGRHSSALQTAALGGHLDVVEFLVEEGADVNHEGEEYESALQAAASIGCLNVVEFLVGMGADINHEGGEYGSALQAAARWKHWDVIELLVEKGADVNNVSALQAAAESGRLDIFVLLIERGVDSSKHGGENGPVLLAADWHKCWDTVKFFIEQKTDPCKDAGIYRSLLRAAFWRGRLDIVELLVQEDVNLNRGDGEYGSQAAFWRGCYAMAELLFGRVTGVDG